MKNRILSLITLVALMFLGSLAFAQSVDSKLEGYVTKYKSEGKPEACYNYIGESLQVVYNTNDFYSKEKGRYLIGNEIASFLEETPSWTKLGTGTGKVTIEKAQELSNQGKPVVAIFKSKMSFGHIVIVLPGEASYSGKWQANMPIVASFFYHKPEASFVDKPMSYAFSEGMRSSVVFYVKN